ncbi:hypothetical protein ACSBR1_034829 [Camellia fascicularis]
MLFYLIALNLARFLREDAPVLKKDESDRQVVIAVDAWKHSNFLCRNYILNGLDNMLHNIYSPLKTAKELWDSLEKKNTRQRMLAQRNLLLINLWILLW